LQWAELASQTGQAGPQQSFTDAITEPALRGRAQLARYQEQIKGSEDLSDESWSQAVPENSTIAHALALQAFARHKANQGSGSEILTTIDQKQPENVRPLGYVGVALGVADRGK
jgi:hypothetical protein